MRSRRPHRAGSGYLVNVATGTSGMSKFNVYRRPNRSIRAQELVTPTSQWSTNGTGVVLAKSGFQDCYSIPYAGKYHLSALFNYVNELTQSQTNYRGTPTRLILEGVSALVQFANTGVGSCHLDIFDVASVRDSGAFTWTFGGGPTFSATPLDPVQAWRIGMAQQTAVNIQSGAEYQMLMARPTDSKLFRDYFKVLQTKRLMLAPGSYHEHRINLKLNHSIGSEIVAYYTGQGGGDNNSIQFFRNVSHHTLYSTYGAPASSTDGSLVSTTPSKIDAVYQMVYTFSFVFGNQKVTWQTDNLQSFATGAQNVSSQNVITPTAFA
jgi:hypothetical protein